MTQSLNDKAKTWAEEVWDESGLPEEEKSLPETLALAKVATALGYAAGYKAATPRWVSLTERLPKIDEWVIVWGTCDYPRISMGQMPGMYDGRRWYGVECDHDGDRSTLDFVSHWLDLGELPEPPKEQP